MPSVPLPVRLSWYACNFAFVMVDAQMRAAHAFTLSLMSGQKAQSAVEEAGGDAALQSEWPATSAVSPAPSVQARKPADRAAPKAAATPAIAKRPRSPSMPPPLPQGRVTQGDPI